MVGRVYVLVMVRKTPLLGPGTGGAGTPLVLPVPGDRPGAEGTKQACCPVLAQLGWRSRPRLPGRWLPGHALRRRGVACGSPRHRRWPVISWSGAWSSLAAGPGRSPASPTRMSVQASSSTWYGRLGAAVVASTRSRWRLTAGAYRGSVLFGSIMTLLTWRGAAARCLRGRRPSLGRLPALPCPALHLTPSRPNTLRS